MTSRTNVPRPGSQVHLVIKEFTAYRHAKPNWTLDATVIDKFWWERDPGAFSVLVPGDEVPTRLIHMKNVISINGEMVEGWDQPLPKAKTWQVESNSTRGQYYTVQFDGNHWKCDCRGFRFHNHCTHCDQIREKEHAATV